MLDARGAISVTERAAYIGRVRALAHRCAAGYLASREALGFPLLPPRERQAAVEAARGGPRGGRGQEVGGGHGGPSIRDRRGGDPGGLRAGGAAAARPGPDQGPRRRAPLPRRGEGRRHAAAAGRLGAGRGAPPGRLHHPGPRATGGAGLRRGGESHAGRRRLRPQPGRRGDRARAGGDAQGAAAGGDPGREGEEGREGPAGAAREARGRVALPEGDAVRPCDEVTFARPVRWMVALLRRQATPGEVRRGAQRPDHLRPPVPRPAAPSRSPGRRRTTSRSCARPR